MNYSNSRVRGYGLLGDLYLIIDNLNWILLKHTKVSVSAMACFLVGEVEGVPIVVYWLETVAWTHVRSYLSLVLVVQVSQIKDGTSASETPPPFALIHVHE